MALVQCYNVTCSVTQSVASIQVTWPLSTNQRPVSRSRDHSRPIRGQYRVTMLQSCWTTLSHHATSIKLDSRTPVFISLYEVLMLTVPWWPFLHIRWQMCNGPGVAFIVWFIPWVSPVAPWSLLTMHNGVINIVENILVSWCTHLAHYSADKYYFIALIPPVVTNIGLGSCKHALLGSLILSENNWNVDCFMKLLICSGSEEAGH